jgi:hypothetical protein
MKLYACSRCHVVQCNPLLSTDDEEAIMWCPVCDMWHSNPIEINLEGVQPNAQ